jgi:hypothetical protein
VASGDWFIEAWSHTDKKASNTLDAAVAAYRRAGQLYPNSALIRAKLAESLRFSGDQSGFRREAETALWLDQITPHIDHKLPSELRERLARDLGSAR